MTKEDRKLFWILILWALIPSVYLLIRMHIISITAADINILGQMEWFDLIDEIITATLSVPLYYILKKDRATPQKNFRAVSSAFIIYFAFAVIISLFISNIASYMKAENASGYLRLQTWSMLIGFVSSLMVILFTLDGRAKIFRYLLIIKTASMVACDLIFIPRFNDIGAAYSDILGNSITAVIAVVLAWKYRLIRPGKTDGKLMAKEWLKTGIFTAVQIFLDNFIYAVIVVRMVNFVSASGTYWVANNFIYGWMLVPVSALTEIVKRNRYDALTFKNVWKPTLFIYAFWAVSAPFWSLFMRYGMSMADSKDVMGIIFPMMAFYIAYVPSQIIDGWFISRGQTVYTAVISVLVNIAYYGITYGLFLNGVFKAGLPFIICMFGFGMVVHLVLSTLLYRFEQTRTVKISQK